MRLNKARDLDETDIKKVLERPNDFGMLTGNYVRVLWDDGEVDFGFIEYFKHLRKI